MFISSLGRTAELTFRFIDNPDRVLFLDCLGATIGVGIGVALANNSTSVYAFETDGSFYYNMTVINSIKKCCNQLTHFFPIIFDNEILESAGGLPSASVGFNWESMARAWGVNLFVSSDEKSLDQYLDNRSGFTSTTLLVIKVNNCDVPDLCTKDIDGIESRYRFKRYINTHIRNGIIRPCLKN